MHFKLIFFKEKLEEVLKMIIDTNYALVPIIFDGAGMNVNVLRQYLMVKSDSKLPLNLKVYSTNFTKNGHKHFIIFCLVHAIKCVRNNLIVKKIPSSIPC